MKVALFKTEVETNAAAMADAAERYGAVAAWFVRAREPQKLARARRELALVLDEIELSLRQGRAIVAKHDMTAVPPRREVRAMPDTSATLH